MTDDERLLQWNNWLDIIYSEVRSLIRSRHVYCRVQEIIAANPAIHQSSTFYDCYSIEHASYAAIAIRRVIELNKRKPVVSLATLLDSISKFPHILSRERYVAAFVDRGYPASLGEDAFNDVVGHGCLHVNPVRVHAELAKLQRLGLACKSFADKRIAHRDSAPPNQLPTYPGIDNCIAHMEDLTKRYLLLIRQETHSTLMPTPLYDWQEIFRKPWISY